MNNGNIDSNFFFNYYFFSSFKSTGEVIKHNDVKCVMNEGMPLYTEPYERGQLIIQFQVS